MADAATLLDDWIDDGIQDGQAVITWTQVWQVGNAANPFEARNAPNIPARGSQSLTSTGELMTCLSRQAKRKQRDVHRDWWLVTVVHSNRTGIFSSGQNGLPGIDASGVPVSDPLAMVKQVTRRTLKIQEPVNDAVLLRFYQPANSPDTVATPSYYPVVGPIVNSALIDQGITRSRSLDQITVTKIIRDWDSTLDEFRDSINNDSVTITETDKDGQRSSKTYSAYTLRMDDTPQIPLWIDGRLYFRRSFVMTYEPNKWYHRMSDRGNTRRMYVNQKNRDGTLVTDADITANGSTWKAITTDGGRYGTVHHGSLLNGDGAPLDYATLNGSSPDKGPILMEHAIYTAKAWSGLKINI